MQSHVRQVNEPTYQFPHRNLLDFKRSILFLTLAALFGDHGRNSVLIAIVPGI
jgi:hypothetical protein